MATDRMGMLELLRKAGADGARSSPLRGRR